MAPNDESSSVDPNWICANTPNTSILSDREILAAKSLLSETLSEVERLDLEMARTPKRLDNLVAQQDEAAARAEKIRIAIAPHKRVPPEILAEIFAHTVEGESLTLPLRAQYSWPWPLRSVCSLWRRVAISERRLWSSIEIRTQDWSNNLGVRLYICLYHLRLQFPTGTGPSKLKLDISGSDTRLDPNAEPPHPIIDLLSPLLPFLRELYLILPLSWCFALFEASALNLALVETLSLDWGATDINDSDDTSDLEDVLAASSAFSAAPGLRKLQIRNISYFEVLNNAPFPWAQLTELDLSKAMLTMMSALNILRQCTQLVGCHLRTTGFSDPGPIHEKEIVLPCLQSMAWERFDDNEHVFSCLVAPSLKEFRVVSIFLPDIASMLQNAPLSIEFFQWESLPDQLREVPYLEDILSNMPTLVEFETSLQVSLLTLEKISSRQLLPCLKVLKCNVSSESLNFIRESRSQDTLQAALFQVWIHSRKKDTSWLNGLLIFTANGDLMGFRYDGAYYCKELPISSDRARHLGISRTVPCTPDIENVQSTPWWYIEMHAYVA
ncbi:hypothetical protein Hypma_002947 [Hypsizygus marmoreus]|uniref:Uncharacterized protein n=1 Tax=Hypsizygus marmoreus TaxID=39966 RepID=A0A369J328_HYPMA|nr:hypothetical protein Hypma_002947 [Hypsizygus marmoreus]